MADVKYLRRGGLYDFGATPAFTTFALNGSTDQWEVVFAAENDGNGNLAITRLGFRYGLRTGTPPTFIISLQGVDASGNPDGTVKGGASPASATFTPPASTAWDGTWQWVTLANSYTAAPGEMLAEVIAYSSGTIDGSNNSTLTTTFTAANNILPYNITNDAGVRTRSSAASLAIFGYGTATKAFGRPCSAITSAVFQSGTNPNEYALKFSLPAGESDTFKIGAFRFVAGLAAAGSIAQKLYSGGGGADLTVLQDTTLDNDQVASPTARPTLLSFDETTLETLTFGSTYRLAVSATAAVNVTLVMLDVAAAADWDAWPGGQDYSHSTRQGGNWSDLATRRLLGEFVVVDVTEAAGGGGGIAKMAGFGGGFVG